MSEYLVWREIKLCQKITSRCLLKSLKHTSNQLRMRMSIFATMEQITLHGLIVKLHGLSKTFLRGLNNGRVVYLNNSQVKKPPINKQGEDYL